MQIKKIIAGLIAASMMTGIIPTFASATETDLVAAPAEVEVIDEVVEEAVIPQEEVMEEASEEVEDEALEEAEEEVVIEETNEAAETEAEEAEETAETETEVVEEEVFEEETTEVEETETEGTVEEVVEEVIENVDEIIEQEKEEEVFELPKIDAIEEADEEEEIELFSATAPTISDYDTFMMYLPLLEELSMVYAAEVPGTDPLNLVIKYIRTGVERYNSGSWGIMAGYEDKDFAEFVIMMQDMVNAELPEEEQLSIDSLKNIDNFYIPNGQYVDFGHMFGTMDITYHNKGSQNHADVGGWAGDIVDLLSTSDRHYVTGDLEEMVDEIREKYLCKNIDESDAFGETDMYGDIDAMCIMDALKASGYETPLSTLIAEYFTTDLSNVDRAEYFIKNRLDGETNRRAMRDAVYNEYTGNSVVSTLEATREFETENLTELRKACCYAFADYMCELAGDYVDISENKFYSVFSNEISTLAPGITQEINYALTVDNKQIAYYIATADITRNDVDVYANYTNNDGSVWAMSRVQDQIEAAQKKHSDPESEHYIKNYNAIVGVNGDFFNMHTGEPSGALVMEGVKYHEPSSSRYFFAILNDGTPYIGAPSDWASVEDNIKEAIGGSALLVENGKSVVDDGSDYYSDRASRTCVGITKTGKVVLMVLDGRQEPFSAGGAYQELAQIMIDAGCVKAMNLDGGGSTTFAAKQEGEDEITIVNRPSDGFARSVSSSLLVVSTAPSSTAFDHAVIESDYDYLTIGTSLQLTAAGVSATGNKAEMPEGYTWEIPAELEKWAEITEDGLFTAKRMGDVEVRIMLDGEVVGTKTIQIVIPDNIKFTRSNLDAVYGEKVVLPFIASYEGKEVKISESDVVITMANEAAGTIDGFTFIGSSEGGIKVAAITAALANNSSKYSSISITLYNQGEATFDFDQAMAGDRQFAWIRNITNTTTTDDIRYEVIDANEPIEASYVFALDMTQIPIPEQLEDLTTMLPGSDVEGASAWTFLLQLAERVSALTEVKPVVKFDKNFYVDYSEIKVVNEYFKLTNTEYNEEDNSITLTLKWVDQTQAVDPATANPLCILSGVKLIPKDDAVWTDNKLTAVVEGDVTYDIYLRASALYTFACKEENQQTYNLYPFVNPDLPSEKGGHFAATYKEFQDTFTLDKTVKNGWVVIGGKHYYFENGVKLTGAQYLPAVDGAEGEYYYYDMGTDGAFIGYVNGLFTYNGDKYWAVNGELVKGWRIDSHGQEDKYYYFDYATGKAVDGVQMIGGYEQTFEDCVLVKGSWDKTEKGVRYRWAGSWNNKGWFVVDGNTYYALGSGYILTGLSVAKITATSEYKKHVFDENGVFQAQVNGLYDSGADTYYVKDGVVQTYPGLVNIDGFYYYFGRDDKMVKDNYAWISKDNGLIVKASYYFGPDGKMEWKEGLVHDRDGEIRYYKDNVPVVMGIVQDTDGSFYYINSTKKAVKGCWYGFSDGAGNGLVPGGIYWFDEDGKMEVKNGLYFEKNGDIRYYENGVPVAKGVVQDSEGNLYYVNSTRKAIKNCWYGVSEGAGNGLVQGGVYWFREDGTLQLKEGLVFEMNGDIRYYENNVPIAVGLVQDLEGNYYYIGSAKKAVKNAWYGISTGSGNGLMPAGTYWFDADGRMELKEGLYFEMNGDICYYENYKPIAIGLVQDLEGNYYYIGSAKKAVRNAWYGISTGSSNGLMPAGTYWFEADGKMELKVGLYFEMNGDICYYENYKPIAVGLVQDLEGNYYYIGSSKKAVKNAWYAFSDASGNGLMPGGKYFFDENGRMVL